MAHDEPPRRAVSASGLGLKPGDAPPGPARPRSAADRRFDMWLEKQLQAIYRIDSEPDST